MKLCYFDDFKLGVVKDDEVVDVSDVVREIPHSGPHDLINDLIENFVDYRQALEAGAEAGSGILMSSVRIRPPLPRPQGRGRGGLLRFGRSPDEKDRGQEASPAGSTR